MEHPDLPGWRMIVETHEPDCLRVRVGAVRNGEMRGFAVAVWGDDIRKAFADAVAYLQRRIAENEAEGWPPRLGFALDELERHKRENVIISKMVQQHARP